MDRIGRPKLDLDRGPSVENALGGFLNSIFLFFCWIEPGEML
jgi:hypothetical protein